MAADDLQDRDLRGEEIAALLSDVKQRVRARYPSASVPVESGGPVPFRVPLADLMPLVHARDAAVAKVAAIGSVNPRPGGPVNQAAQMVKKQIARALAWFVRDQITFNRQTIACIEAAIDAMNELNASISMLAAQFNARAAAQDAETAARFAELQARVETHHASAKTLAAEAAELKDIRLHWQEWRVQWEKNLAANEMQFLRSVADLQTGFSHRATAMETNFRDMVKAQHSDYLGALDRTNLDIQKRLWADLEEMRLDYDRMIHNELRLIRQRLKSPAPQHELAPPAVVPPATVLPPAAITPFFDYARFADRFRGSEEYVRGTQQFYVPFFKGLGRVLDIGCGRGEFLEVLRDNGIPGRGIELSSESVVYCRSKGLDVEQADLFAYLADLPESTEDAIFGAQVVEHLDPARLPEMVRLCASRLRRGGLLAIETPNPESLAIFASHFYLDPTHSRPVPHPLLAFYMEEAGLGKIEVHRLSPAAESFPEIQSLPPDFASRFFGGLDYGILAWKL
jgi:2-polyprenyl-3-methyl-5-hydroxy-6-metoxy-1,4-benzoquinol methylase